MAGGDLPPELLALAGITPEQLAALGSGGGGSGAPLKVYTGRGKPPVDGSRAGLDIQPGRNFPRSTNTDQSEDVETAFRKFYEWDSGRLEKWQRKAYKAGLFGNREPRWGEVGDEASAEVYGRLVDRAASLYSIGRKRLTVDDLLDMALQGSSGLKLDEERKPFTGSKSRTDTDVSITNPQTAKTGLLDYLREELGRAPDEKESRAFIRALQAAQQQNPSRRSTTSTFVEDELTASSSVTNEGLDPRAFMQDYVNTDEALSTERNTFRVATDYYDAAMGVLGEGGL